jgi:hypothetical protein
MHKLGVFYPNVKIYFMTFVMKKILEKGYLAASYSLMDTHFRK